MNFTTREIPIPDYNDHGPPRSHNDPPPMLPEGLLEALNRSPPGSRKRLEPAGSQVAPTPPPAQTSTSAQSPRSDGSQPTRSPQTTHSPALGASRASFSTVFRSRTSSALMAGGAPVAGSKTATIKETSPPPHRTLTKQSSKTSTSTARSTSSGGTTQEYSSRGIPRSPTASDQPLLPIPSEPGTAIGTPEVIPPTPSPDEARMRGQAELNHVRLGEFAELQGLDPEMFRQQVAVGLGLDVDLTLLSTTSEQSNRASDADSAEIIDDQAPPSSNDALVDRRGKPREDSKGSSIWKLVSRKAGGKPKPNSGTSPAPPPLTSFPSSSTIAAHENEPLPTLRRRSISTDGTGSALSFRHNQPSSPGGRGRSGLGLEEEIEELEAREREAAAAAAAHTSSPQSSSATGTVRTRRLKAPPVAAGAPKNARVEESFSPWPAKERFTHELSARKRRKRQRARLQGLDEDDLTESGGESDGGVDTDYSETDDLDSEVEGTAYFVTEEVSLPELDGAEATITPAGATASNALKSSSTPSLSGPTPTSPPKTGDSTNSTRSPLTGYRTAPLPASSFGLLDGATDFQPLQDGSALAQPTGRARSLSEAAALRLTPGAGPSRLKRSGLSSEVKPDGVDGGSLSDRPVSSTMARSSSSRRTGERSKSHDAREQALPSGPADLVIAIVGPRGVGKTTIIKRGLRKPLSKPKLLAEDTSKNQVMSYTATFSNGGQSRSVDILEVDMNALQFSEEGLIWPRYLPPIDGAMLCYDATDEDALDSLRVLLRGFWTRGGITLIVLACRSKLPGEGEDLVNPHNAAELCNIYGAGIVQLDGSTDESSRKMRNSFHWMIKTVVESRATGDYRHSAAFSFTSERRVASPEPAKAVAKPAAPPMASSHSAQSRPSSSSSRKALPVGMPMARESSLPASDLGLPVVTSSPVLRRPRSHSHAGSTLSEARSTTKSDAGSEPPVPVDDAEKAGPISIQSLAILARGPLRSDLHFSRDVLIDKYLFSALTDNDYQEVQFSALFIVVFRRFARPYDVLDMLVERFNFVSGRLQDDLMLSKYMHMKLCRTLAQWVESYPGDFVAKPTFGILANFVEGLLQLPHVLHYAVELYPKLALIAHLSDPDAAWALPDRGDTDAEVSADPAPNLMSAVADRKSSLVPSFSSGWSGDQTDDALPSDPHSPMNGSFHGNGLGDEDYDDLDGVEAPSSADLNAGGRRYRSKSDAGTATTSGTTGTGGSTDASSIPRGPHLSRSVLDISNIVGDMQEELLAMQISRLEWNMFRLMKPRDLIRYVLAPRDPSNPSIALRSKDNPVSQVIRFANHISDWVATMILVQPKQKGRVKIFEKLVSVAYCLRDTDSFEPLVHVLAGLASQPIHRLDHLSSDGTATRPSHKRFLSLKRLMSTNRSFSAYRMALQGAGALMLPYLGVHLQDITRLHEGKNDMKDGQVNWSKFQAMAKAAAIVADCPRLAPDLPYDGGITELIFCDTLDRDEQFEVSYRYKPKDLNHSASKGKLRKLLDFSGA